MDTLEDADLQKATSLLSDIREKSTDASELIKNMCRKAEAGDYNTSKGISFLEVKYQMLLSYLINLTYTMLRKVSGLSINGDTAINRLVEIRTVLEKIRPIDQKLKYQIDKVIRTATTGSAGEADPLRMKANPDNLESKLEDESGSGSEEDEDDKKKSKVYRPPKLAAAHYDGDETVAEKQQRQLEGAKKRALNSDIMRELKEQYHDGPLELRETRDVHRLKEDRRANDRQRFEEENFVRLSLSKREKHNMKRMATMASLETLTHFDNIGGLGMDGATETGMPAKKRKLDKKSGKKGKGKGKGKRKGSKGRRH